VESVRRLWECNSSFALLYHSVGDIKGKTILLLGNGISLKELRFVAEGANVVYTDISLHAVLAVKRAYENSSLARHSTGQIEFHAVDALHLPFGDEVFDVIYGCALVHHIQDLCAFFGQVRRCLKAGGKCVFLDDAYSPMWQFAKTTALRPLQMFSQWRSGISPEDKFATQRGGYRLEELQGIQTSYGFRELMYQRTMFLEHLARRGSAKLLTKGIGEVFAPVGRFIDVRLLGRDWIRAHGLCT
jgi:SAM-dependent methyltransferase